MTLCGADRRVMAARMLHGTCVGEDAGARNIATVAALVLVHFVAELQWWLQGALAVFAYE